MKVLIVSQYFWPESFRINDIAEGLIEKGHEVTVLTGLPNYPEGKIHPGFGWFRNTRHDYKGAKVIRVPLIPRGNSSGSRLILNYLSFALFSCLLAPIVCRGKYDAILVFQLSPITCALPAILLRRLKSIPIICWIQDLWPESLSATGAINSNLILSWVEKLVRFIYKRCDRILIQSKAFSDSIISRGVDEERLFYLPNSIENFFQPIANDQKQGNILNIPAGFKVMFAGNIGAAQDFQTIVAAAGKLKEYKDIQWVILGDGRLRTWAEEEVKKKGLTECFHFLGRHPLESMPAFFACADAMLVTLKRDPIFALTIPSKVQSYMACGKPIVAALDGEGARVVADAEAGLTCPAESPLELADRVLELYRTPETLRREMGNRGLAYCRENFGREKVLSQLETSVLEAMETYKLLNHGQ